MLKLGRDFGKIYIFLRKFMRSKYADKIKNVGSKGRGIGGRFALGMMYGSWVTNNRNTNNKGKNPEIGVCYAHTPSRLLPAIRFFLSAEEDET